EQQATDDHERTPGSAPRGGTTSVLVVGRAAGRHPNVRRPLTNRGTARQLPPASWGAALPGRVDTEPRRRGSVGVAPRSATAVHAAAAGAVRAGQARGGQAATDGRAAAGVAAAAAELGLQTLPAALEVAELALQVRLEAGAVLALEGLELLDVLLQGVALGVQAGDGL